MLHDRIDLRLGGWWRDLTGVKGARGLGPSVALDVPAHHLEQLPGYRDIRLIDHAGVALGVAVHEDLLILDVLEGLAQPPPP